MNGELSSALKETIRIRS